MEAMFRLRLKIALNHFAMIAMGTITKAKRKALLIIGNTLCSPLWDEMLYSSADLIMRRLSSC